MKSRCQRHSGGQGKRTESSRSDWVENPVTKTKPKTQNKNLNILELVPIVKCLLHKHEDLSSGPRTSLVVYDRIPSQGGGDWGSLDSGASSLIYSEPKVREVGSTQRMIPRLSSGFYMHGHLPAYTQTHIHTKILAQKLTLKCQVPKG